MFGKWVVPVAVILLAVYFPAQAHRLDEYLQATTIGLARDGITLRLRLTPGVDMADRVIRQIDRNGDGVMSTEEQRGYAERIAGNLSLSLNGKSVSLRPDAGAFPTIDMMKGGTGLIDIAFDAQGRLGNGPYHLVYRNRPADARTVWLVNCLLPQDPSIHILQQKRSKDQSLYQLDFLVDNQEPVKNPSR
ncbi:hypothetical protein [Komagataeibacter sp. FNDCR2]|uniref:hypothetical protein n=1 Tax=Komagataeibacter sp. FNDCR2 TaxID=2878682 RepID=UPI001E2F125C|nr:hypothetical protein [Komagataeibacter sp. FNDCR2]MCE2576553.1 hypothetical protein [Komagataeibacter sp. FNDCR2]